MVTGADEDDNVTVRPGELDLGPQRTLKAQVVDENVVQLTSPELESRLLVRVLGVAAAKAQREAQRSGECEWDLRVGDLL